MGQVQPATPEADADITQYVTDENYNEVSEGLASAKDAKASTEY